MEFGNTHHLVSGALRDDLGHSDGHAATFRAVYLGLWADVQVARRRKGTQIS